MKGSLRFLVPVLVAGLLQVGPISSARDAPASAASNADALAAFAQLPLAFVPNAGQSDGRIRFQAQAGGVSFSFMRDQVVFAFAKGERGQALALRFLNANPRAAIRGGGKLPGRVNYLLGRDPARWKTELPTFGELVYRELWPGIDVAFRGERGRLKYEFRLRPGARVEQIRLAYERAERLSLTPSGTLAIHTPLAMLADARPVSYQRIGGKQHIVSSRYALHGSRVYGFVVGAYDRRQPLVIDPGLGYSTYLGGALYDDGLGGIAVDRAGNAYVVGRTDSPDFPTTPGAFDETHNGRRDVFVAKLNAAGSAPVYSTFIGGSDFDEGLAITVDRHGNIYVTGNTASIDFPTTPGAFDRTHNGHSDVFVTKLNAAGSRPEYSTFLGGAEDSDFGMGVAVDPSGNAYTTGSTSSDDFPTTDGAYDTTYGGDGDSFVAKLDAAGGALAYSTFLGGTKYDDGEGIALDGVGNAYVTGGTTSADFPTTPGAFDRTFNSEFDDEDAYVTKLNTAGSALIYSTFLGGRGSDAGLALVLDRQGKAYVTGYTDSPDFPTTADAFDRTFNGRTTLRRYLDAFVTELNAVGSGLVYSTFLGGAQHDSSSGIAFGPARSTYVTGATCSADFPTTPGAFDPTYNGNCDAFVTSVNGSGSALTYSTFLGGSLGDSGQGIATERTRQAYVTGHTESADFPTTADAFDTTYNGNGDAFVTKLRP